MFLGYTSYTAASLNLFLSWQPPGSGSARGPHEEQTSKPIHPAQLRVGKALLVLTYAPPPQKKPQKPNPKPVSVQYPLEILTPRVSAINLSKWNCWFWHKERPQLVRRGLYTISYIWRGFTWASLNSHKYRHSLFLLLVSLPTTL